MTLWIMRGIVFVAWSALMFGFGMSFGEEKSLDNRKEGECHAAH